MGGPRGATQVTSQLFVLDSFAALAYLKDEPGGETVMQLLKRASLPRTSPEAVRLRMSYVNLGEVYYRVWRERGELHANRVLYSMKNWPVEFVAADEQLCLAAARFKAAFPLAYGDCFTLATATLSGAVVVTGDPDFRQVQHLVEICWIA